MKRKKRISRREFMGKLAASTAAITIVPAHVLGRNAPSNKLNIAAIGAGGRARANLKGVSDENVVALCDVDEERAARTFDAHPKAKKYKDFRVMLDEMDKSIDAVLVSTPDHTHAVAAMRAIRMGKHVYCEKPLAHSIYEVRQITEAARKYKVQTQMGNQGHSSERIRMMCEWVRDGAIGKVRKVHAWSSRPSGGAAFAVNMRRPQNNPAVPAGLDWDLWLGPAPSRPYDPAYLPFKWRGWVDFGTGALGDMGCHILDPVFWALKLGEVDTIEVEATTTHFEPEIMKETYPVASVVRFKFPARGNMPQLKLTWSDGRLRPPRPDDMEINRKIGGEGALLYGENGNIMHGSHGAGGLRIVPEDKMKAYELPAKTLPRSKGHHQDWILACKGGKPASSNFDYGGPLTEMALLGVLAIRNQNRKLIWDAKKMRVTNDKEADKYVNPPYRDGWTL
ncbi:MAG: Gfo/Idh/MocA family protein [Planctomycetota bacterium]|jgi:predicted dehydrogenase